MKTKKINILLITLMIFTVVAVFYFSWIKDPTFNSENYIPTVIKNWCNIYFNFRTAIPFIILSVLGGIFILKNDYTKFTWAILCILYTIICAIAEIGQLFIKTRSCDFIDFLYGCLGSLLGFLIAYIYNKLYTIFVTKK